MGLLSIISRENFYALRTVVWTVATSSATDSASGIFTARFVTNVARSRLGYRGKLTTINIGPEIKEPGFSEESS
jgi:hypothetical protein